MPAAARTIASLAALFLAALFVATLPGIAKPAQAPGSRVVLDLPDGFAISPSFSGFVHVVNGTTIMLLEVPASAYPEMSRGLNPPALSQKGVSNAETGTLDRQGEYHYVRGDQTTASGSFAKFIMLFQEGTAAALVSITVPDEALQSGSADPATLAHILASARIDPKAGEKPFVLGYSGPFKDTGSFIGQSHFYAIADAPAEDGNAVTQPPTLVIAASLDGPRIDDLEATGRVGIAELAGGQEPETIESQPLNVAGLEGIEQVASPHVSASGAGIYQVILLSRGGGYYRIVGQAPGSEWPALLPEFRKIAASFSPRP